MDTTSIQAVAAPPLPSSLHIPSLGSTFGALLISAFVTLLLYGLTVNQLYHYLFLWHTDASTLKMIVLGLFIADTLHCVITSHLCYHYLTTDYLNPLDLNNNVWSFQMMAPVTASLMLAELGLCAAYSQKSFTTKTFVAESSSILRLVTAVFGVAVFIDCTLTSALVVILRWRRTDFQRTNDVLNTLALYAVIATSLNSALSIPAFILVLLRPYDFIWVAVAIPVTKVYSNSVLAMLNCRAFLRAGEGTPFPNVRGTAGTNAPQRASQWLASTPVVDPPALLQTPQNGSERVYQLEYAASSHSGLSAVLHLLEELLAPAV
ncbi:hypothetical protein C8Q74DRAFT_1363609 [Fomes fomentarius]|nr:hypothetical protein C8Q74DRAFT_1363609 [Fomes fomentarius]